MIKIAQFGEGNFLRAFADYYFDVLNEQGGNYAVSIIKPREQGSLDKFVNQKNLYHVVLRGMENALPVEKIRKISVVKEVFKYSDKADFERLAADSNLRLVISNTTEAGIYFRVNIDDLRGSSYRLNLRYFCGGFRRTWSIYAAGGAIDNNADKLKNASADIFVFELPEAFFQWNERENFYCNTLWTVLFRIL